MNKNYITALSAASAEERDELALFWRRLPEEGKVLVETLIAEVINSKRSKLVKEYQAEFYYACRIVAIKQYKQTLGGPRRKGMSDEEAARLQDLRISALRSKKKKDRSTPLADIIRIRFAEIRQLREDKKLTWRDLAKYLEQYTNTKIHYTYLRGLYSQIKEVRGNDD